MRELLIMPSTNSETRAFDGADRFIGIFRLAARQAGSLARHLQQDVRLKQKEGEDSAEGAALTSVDLAAQEIILLALKDAFPDAGMDAEEKTDTLRFFHRDNGRRPTIVIDPVDGTLNYGTGSPDYAVMGAWLEGGSYLSALVHFPHLEDTYWAVKAKGSRLQRSWNDVRNVTVDRTPGRVLVSPHVSEDLCESLRRTGLEAEVSRCSAVDALAPLTGRASAALTVGRPDRRRALGYLITLEAGGAVWTGDRWWNGEDPLTLPDYRGITLVAGTKETAGRIMDALG